jgi:two-component system, chemotaxis family, protein-glutamate methylesterase/glutaminase
MEEAKSKMKLLVIGGSAGGLSMVLKIIPLLKRTMNLAVIIVFHRKHSDDNVLVDVLSKRTTFSVKEADDKDALAQGNILIAPADYHLLLEKDGTITLDDSEKVHYSRPSIDVTFESATEAFADSLTCVLLSGANADGVSGLVAAKKAGACVVVQSPASAEVSFMPQAALDKVKPDLIIDDTNLSRLIDMLSTSSLTDLKH